MTRSADDHSGIETMHESREIMIDATEFKSIMDFIDALKAALKSPAWHGASVDAFIDSIVYGSINEIEPPFKIIAINTNHLASDLRIQIHHFLDAIADAADHEGKASVIRFEIS
jgi:RNAse (barnase) inhibitor barstar